jgi:urea carboxylase system permease
MTQPAVDDTLDLAHLGYRAELKRVLGPLGTFAASFVVISILVGLFTTFALGYAFAGPPVAWTVLVVLAGQLMVALVFAELAAHLPLTGSIYQWAHRVGGPGTGLVGGWIYLVAWFVSLPSIAIGLQATLTALSPDFQLFGSGVPGIFDPDFAKNAAILGLALLAISTTVNVLGVRAVERVAKLGLFVEIVGVVALFVVLLTHVKRGPNVAFHNLGLGSGHAWGYLGALLIGVFLPMYQLYGFDTATSFSEETKDPRRTGPRSMLRSLISAGLLSFVLTMLVSMAVGNVNDPEISSGGLQYVVTELTSGTLGNLLLIDVVITIVCAGVTIHSLSSRLVFAAARDGLVPFSARLRTVRTSTQVPVPAVILPAGIGVLLLLVNLVNTKFFEALVTVGVLLAYLAYLVVTSSYLFRRIRGEWAAEPGLFSLGRWGTPVAVLAILWGAAGAIDLAWPRPEFLGELWYQRYMGIIVPVVVIVAAAGYYLAVVRPRGGDHVLEEHPLPHLANE